MTLKVPATGQPAADYTVQVKGLDATTGKYLVGFYLPGDVTGAGTVTQADIKTIKSITADGARTRITTSTPTSIATASSTART